MNIYFVKLLCKSQNITQEKNKKCSMIVGMSRMTPLPLSFVVNFLLFFSKLFMQLFSINVLFPLRNYSSPLLRDLQLVPSLAFLSQSVQLFQHSFTFLNPLFIVALKISSQTKLKTKKQNLQDLYNCKNAGT